jgi:hypothetical protein
VYNVPPPGIDADAATLKDASDRESPPQSFYQLQANCAIWRIAKKYFVTT